MLIQIKVDLKTLDAVCDDPDVTINEINADDGQLLIEVSKPDPETSMATS